MNDQPTGFLVVRGVIRWLGLLTLTLIIGSLMIARKILEHQPLDATAVSVLLAFTGLVGVGLGSMGTLLATTGHKGEAPQPVEVTNTPDAPVPTEPVEGE